MLQQFILLVAAGVAAAAFVPSPAPVRTGAASRRAARELRMGTAADEMGMPCVGECALASYPNLPPTVHPGVVTGQALTDLLADAKEKGYAIPAVNCVTSSSVNACLEAARQCDAPIIIQFSSRILVHQMRQGGNPLQVGPSWIRTTLVV